MSQERSRLPNPSPRHLNDRPLEAHWRAPADLLAAWADRLRDDPDALADAARVRAALDALDRDAASEADFDAAVGGRAIFRAALLWGVADPAYDRLCREIDRRQWGRGYVYGRRGWQRVA